MPEGELGRAYRSFLPDPEAGVHQTLAADHHSNWETWIRKRLLRKAAHLRGRQITVNLPELAALPPDTLGRCYARHMMSLGLDPDAFIGDFEDEDGFDQRMAIAHDLYHIVTGFDASPLGEFGVAAFTLIQYWNLLNVFVISFVPISLANPLWTVPLLHNLWRGFRIGKACRPVIGYPFELNWEKPLRQVRQELGLELSFRPH